MAREQNKSAYDPGEIDTKRISRIRRMLLTWFDRQKRDLPWRRTRDPYAVWLSEMMLQQTQVATVIPYYEKFMAQFPTVGRLADADLEDVLRLWSGLGYYARARNLHRAAQTVAAEHGGVFPATVDGLRALPGIGAYTAGAVASIAFGKKAPVVDGNVARVLARLFEINADVRDGVGLKLTWKIAGRMLPNKRCGDFNQAVMELGATVCLPKGAARCSACPLQSECQGFASGTVSELPIKTRKTAVKNETHVVVAIERRGQWLVVRRPKQGLWGGLWEMPTAVLNGEPTFTLARRLAADFSSIPVNIERKPFCTLKHQLSHRSITFVGHVCHLKRPVAGIGPKKPGKWLRLNELDGLGLSTAMRNVFFALRKTVEKSNGRAAGNATKCKKKVTS